jgi:hypothetical protein
MLDDGLAARVIFGFYDGLAAVDGQQRTSFAWLMRFWMDAAQNRWYSAKISFACHLLFFCLYKQKKSK